MIEKDNLQSYDENIPILYLEKRAIYKLETLNDLCACMNCHWFEIIHIGNQLLNQLLNQHLNLNEIKI